MQLKHFLLFGPEGISDVKKSFSFQTRCVTKLFERMFEKDFETQNCKQLNFQCGNYSEFKLLDCTDGFCEVLVPYDIEGFLNSPDHTKKVQTLILFKKSLDWVIREKNGTPILLNKHIEGY